MKYIAHWYNQTEIVSTDPEPIIADNVQQATELAWTRHHGKPPAPLLFLEEA